MSAGILNLFNISFELHDFIKSSYMERYERRMERKMFDKYDIEKEIVTKCHTALTTISFLKIK